MAYRKDPLIAQTTDPWTVPTKVLKIVDWRVALKAYSKD
jgi:hypothetical protein